MPGAKAIGVTRLTLRDIRRTQGLQLAVHHYIFKSRFPCREVTTIYLTLSRYVRGAPCARIFFLPLSG